MFATLNANAEHKPKVQFKQDTIGKLIDIQAKLAKGKAQAMSVGQRSTTSKHGTNSDPLAGERFAQRGRPEPAHRQTGNQVSRRTGGGERPRRSHEIQQRAALSVAAYASTKIITQQLKAAKRPAAFEEQHRAELTAYRAAAAYFKANNITKLPSPKKLEAEYAQLASEKAKFYEQYKEAKEELLKLKTAKQNVASFFREEEPAQQER